MPISSKTKLVEVKFETRKAKEAAIQAALKGEKVDGKMLVLSARETKRILFREYAIDTIIQDRKDAAHKRNLKPEDREQFMMLTGAYLEGKNIAENRDDAKRLGVENVGTMTKDELIGEVLSKIWGFQIFSDEFVITREPDLEKVDEEDEIRAAEQFRSGKLVAGELISGLFEGDEMGGYIRVKKFYSSADDAYVPRAVVNTLKLEEGDYLEARIHYDEKLCFNVTHWVDKVNGEKVGYDNFAENLAASHRQELATPKNRIVFGREQGGVPLLMDVFAPVCLGQAVIVSSRGRLNFARHALTLAEAAKKSLKADEVLTFIPNESDFSYQKIGKPDGILTSSETSHNTNAEIARRMCAYAQKRAEYGYNVLVILGDLDSAASTGEEAKALLRRARQISGGGSATIIAFCDMDRENDMYYEVRRMAACDCVFWLVRSIKTSS